MAIALPAGTPVCSTCFRSGGVETFRTKVEAYLGKPLQPYRKLPVWEYRDYLGWYEQGDGHWFVGVNIDNGRIYDNGTLKLRTALKEIVQRFQLPMRVTGSQSAILYDIKPGDKDEIQAILTRYGVIEPDQIDSLTRYAMACPALPTCGLAITESERVIPDILGRVRSLLDRLGLKNEHFVVRMTGCPNGCARPYMAELGFVGSAPEAYQIWLGGSPNQTRLARPFIERMKVDTLETTLEPLFVQFRDQRRSRESFGDFCDRLGFEALRQFADQYDSAQYKAPKRDRRHRIGINEDVYELLKEISDRQGRPMSQVTADAIHAYIAQQSNP
jgi:sulfite reductase (ferredoxin)